MIGQLRSRGHKGGALRGHVPAARVGRSQKWCSSVCRGSEIAGLRGGGWAAAAGGRSVIVLSEQLLRGVGHEGRRGAIRDSDRGV
jgi:hypothetical protein